MNLKLKYTGFLVTVFLSVAVVIMITIFGLLTIDKRYFATKHIYYTHFNDANGLSTSTPVIFKGFKIGRIEDFSMLDDSRIFVTINIYDEYVDLIVKKSVLKKTTNFLSGASSISYQIYDQNKEPLPPESEIPSVDFAEGKKIAKDFKLEFSEELVYSLLSNLNTLTKDLNREHNEEKLLVSTLKKLNTLSDDLQKASENIVVLTDVMRNEVEGENSSTRKMLHDVDQLAKKLEVTAVTFTRVLENADTLINSYKNPDSLLFKILDPEGNNIISPVSDILHTADTLIGEHTNFAKFLNSQQAEIQLILMKLNTTINELNKSIEGINNNPLISPGIQPRNENHDTRRRVK